MKTQSNSRRVPPLIWRQVNFQFCGIKILIFTGTLILNLSIIFLVFHLQPRREFDYANKETALMDFPCDNALRNICPHDDTANCSGICLVMSVIDSGGKWEVKLQLYSGANDWRNPIPVLEVYGATDEVCEEMGLDNYSVHRRGRLDFKWEQTHKS